MSRHLTQDIAQKAFEGSEPHHRALRIGRYTPGHHHIDLPDDFDWSGQTPPASVPFVPSAPSSEPPPFGLGDLTAWLIKNILRIRRSECPPCQRRRSGLNRIIPDIWHPFKRR